MFDTLKKNHDALARLDRHLDSWVFVAALASVPVALEAGTPHGWLLVVDLIAWSIFVFEAVIRISAHGPQAYFKNRWNWVDLLIIVVSAPYYLLTGIPLMARLGSVARLARLFRLTLVSIKAMRQGRRFLSRRNLPFGAAITIVAVIGVAAVVHYFEGRAGNEAFDSYPDALWWAIVTLTTVGYGDLSPVTGTGRIGAVFLMFVGVGFLGTVAASLASLLVEESDEANQDPLRKEMESLRGEIRGLREQLEKHEDRRP